MSTPSAILLDTGAWLLGLAGDEPYAEVMESAGELIVPGLTLAEVDYHLRRRRREMQRVLAALDDGKYVYEPPTPEDLQRAAEIDQKFASIGLGLVDASVAALAERLGIHSILTIDSDFISVRVGPRWQTALELIVPPPSRR
jgi:predicted nucleic acid-binding protein